MKMRIFALALFVVAAVACNGMFRGSGASNQVPTTIRVDNQDFPDMNVYAARSAERVRLGTAPGHTSTVFTIPPVLISGSTPLRFIADPIGGRRASVSEEITVSPGDSVVLTIPPV